MEERRTAGSEDRRRQARTGAGREAEMAGSTGSGRQASSAALRLFLRRRNEGVRIALWDFG